MSRRAFFLAVFAMASMSGAALAEDTPNVLHKSRMLAAEKRYDEALKILRQAQAHYPKDLDIKLAIARTLSWKGNDKDAGKILAPLHARNPDLLILKADLASHAGNYAEAEALYRKAAKISPGYKDASDGVQRAVKARAAQAQERKEQAALRRQKAEKEQYTASLPEAQPTSWQIDTGVEISSFARVPQSGWNNEFFQLTYFTSDHGTALHTKATRYEQFGNVDSEYEFGIDHRFSPSLYGHLYLSGSPDPVFRPEWRLDAGGGIRVSEDILPVWFTLDARHDSYPTLNVETINPGVRIEPLDNWSLAARLITVSQPGASTVYGWDMRLDGPITESTRFYIGYANAPETVAAVTVQTETFFGGFALDVAPNTTLRLGYAHDDRENSYIRHVFNVGISYRF